MSKKLKVLIVAAVLVTLVFQIIYGILVVKLVSGVNKDYVFYLKNRELCCSDFLENGNCQLTDDIFYGTTISASEIDLYKDSIGSKIYVKNGIMFYPDDCKVSINGSMNISLYYKRTGKINNDPVLIENNISDYRVSDDGDLVTYRANGALYQYSLLRGKSEVISSVGVKNYFMSEDGKKIVYLNKNDELWYKELGKDKEKLDDVISKVYYVNTDLNTVYYKKYNTLYKKEVGKDPVKIDEGINIYCISAYDSGEMYYVTYENNVDMLWYFDGENSVNISKRMGKSFFAAKEKAAMVIPLSGKWSLLVGDKVTPIDGNIEFARISDDGKTVYYIASKENSCGDLYKIKISGDRVSEPVLYDTDIVFGMQFLDDDDMFVYYKEEITDGEYSLALYYNGERMGSNVYRGNLKYDEETDKLYYISDWNDETNSGTLKVYNGKIKTISEGVYRFDLSLDGKVVFLTDYKVNSRKGDLYAYNGKKTIKLDEDVNCIFPVERDDD